VVSFGCLLCIYDEYLKCLQWRACVVKAKCRQQMRFLVHAGVACWCIMWMWRLTMSELMSTCDTFYQCLLLNCDCCWDFTLWYLATIIVISCWYHCSILLLSLWYIATLIVVSCWYHCSILLLSLWYIATIIVVSCYSHCGILLISLISCWYHCDILLISLWHHRWKALFDNVYVHNSIAFIFF